MVLPETLHKYDMELDAVRIVFLGAVVVTVRACLSEKLPLAVRPRSSEAATLTDMLVPVSPAVVNHSFVGVTVMLLEFAVVVYSVVDPRLNVRVIAWPSRFVKEIVTLLPTPTVLGAMFMPS